MVFARKRFERGLMWSVREGPCGQSFDTHAPGEASSAVPTESASCRARLEL